MRKNPLNFKDQNLVVDYISFKFQNSDLDQDKIADYLFNLNFNVYSKSGKFKQSIKHQVLFDPNNLYEAYFVEDNPNWDGTLLHFSGLNSCYLYSLIKDNKIDWQVLNAAVLNRFDLYFEREFKITDPIPVKHFLRDCQQKLKQGNRKTSLEENKSGWILRIGNRRTNNYLRIYEKGQVLRFEHEMKGKLIEKYHILLCQNNFEKLEQTLCLNFFKYFGKLLPLEYSYLDWLVVRLRIFRKQSNLKNNFNSDYIKSEIKTDNTTFITLLQFLNYAQHLDYETIELSPTISYRVVAFRLQDFLQVQNKNINQYQLSKTKTFFENLQKGILVQSFSNKKFQSLIAVPIVEFEKIKKYNVVKVWLVENLFYYQYPFLLPDLFNTKLNKHEFAVRCQFVKIFSSVNIEKKFLIKDYLNSYPSIVSNKQKSKIKQYFLDVIEIVRNQGLIESYYKIISDESGFFVTELRISEISTGFVIYEKLIFE